MRRDEERVQSKRRNRKLQGKGAEGLGGLSRENRRKKGAALRRRSATKNADGKGEKNQEGEVE